MKTILYRASAPGLALTALLAFLSPLWAQEAGRASPPTSRPTSPCSHAALSMKLMPSRLTYRRNSDLLLARSLPIQSLNSRRT
jgi:hypothetical protein